MGEHEGRKTLLCAVPLDCYWEKWSREEHREIQAQEKEKCEVVVPAVSRALERQRVTVSTAIIPAPANLSLTAHQVWILLGDFCRYLDLLNLKPLMPSYVLLTSFLFFIKGNGALFLGFS